LQANAYTHEGPAGIDVLLYGDGVFAIRKLLQTVSEVADAGEDEFLGRLELARFNEWQRASWVAQMHTQLKVEGTHLRVRDIFGLPDPFDGVPKLLNCID